MYQILEEKISGSLLFPGKSDYEEKRKVWNAAIDKRPACIVVCENEDDIAAALSFANKNDLGVSVKGGGHHVAGFGSNDGGVMLDMSKMRKVSVDEKRQVVIVEGGATAGDIDKVTQQYGLAVPLGTVSKVGVGGLALSGGLGYLRGKYGLTCDNIVAARVVTANGEILDVNEESHSDLFWAIRGGDGNFGVVTRFELALHQVGPEVLALDVMYDLEDAKIILRNLDAYISSAPDEAIAINVTATVLPPAHFLPEFLHMKDVMMISAVYVGAIEKGKEVFQPLRELAKPIMDQTGILPFHAVQKKLDAMVPEYTNVYGTSLYFEDMNEEVIDALVAKINSAPAPTFLIQLWALGGQMNRIPVDATAFAIRGAKYALLADIMAMPGEEEICEQWAEVVYGGLLPFSYKQASYLNGIGKGENIAALAYQENYERLIQVKRKYDPDNKFCHNHNINPNG